MPAASRSRRDLTINVGRQSTRLAHQVLPDLVELRVGDANSSVCAEQQERRNDGRSITSTAVYTALAPNRFKDFWRE
jgi:hypothetical protein